MKLLGVSELLPPSVARAISDKVGEIHFDLRNL